MRVTLQPLRPSDAAAVVAAEDEATVRWLSGGRSTVEGTADFVRRLDREAEQGAAKRAFGIWLDGACVGTADYDPDVTDGLEPGDVNIAYGVAPWARGHGIAVRAVELLCAIIHDRGIGTRAVIRADVRNPASTRVAEKARFTYLRDVTSSTERQDDGAPVTLRVYGHELAHGSRPGGDATDPEGVSCRLAAPGDEEMLRRTLHMAWRWDREWDETDFRHHVSRGAPDLYVDHFGMRPGDTGILAVTTDPEERAIGAAWYRYFSNGQHREGFVDECTPEIVLAVGPEHRGQGIGGLLLDRLLDLARRRGVARLSLHVDLENDRALSLYRSRGFAPVSRTRKGLVMSLQTQPDSNGGAHDSA